MHGKNYPCRLASRPQTSRVMLEVRDKCSGEPATRLAVPDARAAEKAIDMPGFRVDNLPYGGVKLSGLGREGIRYAIKDMTEVRLMMMRES